MTPLLYLGAFAGAAALCASLGSVVIRLAIRFDLFDRPGGSKQQSDPVPLLGGAAILGAFLAGVLAIGLLIPLSAGKSELAAVTVAAIVLVVVGLVDDIRTLGPFVRLGFEALASVAILATDGGIQLTGSPVLDGALTVLWVLLVTNAFNLLDNMDGLSAGVGGIAAASILLIAGFNGQFLVASLAAALAGCTAGFLRHNRPPARLYMGDAGSLLIGFLMAYLSIKLDFSGPTRVTFLVPVVVLAVPLFDTGLVFFSRLAHRLNPLDGGRDHTSHRLVRLGLSPKAAVGVICGAAVACGWLGLVISRLDMFSAYLLTGLLLAGCLASGAVLGSVPVYGGPPGRVISALRGTSPAASSGNPSR